MRSLLFCYCVLSLECSKQLPPGVSAKWPVVPLPLKQWAEKTDLCQNVADNLEGKMARNCLWPGWFPSLDSSDKRWLTFPIRFAIKFMENDIRESGHRFRASRCDWYQSRKLHIYPGTIITTVSGKQHAEGELNVTFKNKERIFLIPMSWCILEWECSLATMRDI